MDKQEKTGWTIVALILILLWWLSKNGLALLHGTSVQTTMTTGDTTQTNQATTSCDTCA